VSFHLYQNRIPKEKITWQHTPYLCVETKVIHMHLTKATYWMKCRKYTENRVSSL